jgi:hypothetical protein
MDMNIQYIYDIEGGSATKGGNKITKYVQHAIEMYLSLSYWHFIEI